MECFEHRYWCHNFSFAKKQKMNMYGHCKTWKHLKGVWQKLLTNCNQQQDFGALFLYSSLCVHLLVHGLGCGTPTHRKSLSINHYGIILSLQLAALRFSPSFCVASTNELLLLQSLLHDVDMYSQIITCPVMRPENWSS